MTPDIIFNDFHTIGTDFGHLRDRTRTPIRKRNRRRDRKRNRNPSRKRNSKHDCKRNRNRSRGRNRNRNRSEPQAQNLLGAAVCPPFRGRSIKTHKNQIRNFQK